MKKCENVLCVTQMDEARTAKFCCARCRMQAHNRSLSPDEKAAKLAALKKWKAENPERVKAKGVRERSQRYQSGKLPSWMYS